MRGSIATQQAPNAVSRTPGQMQTAAANQYTKSEELSVGVCVRCVVEGLLASHMNRLGPWPIDDAHATFVYADAFVLFCGPGDLLLATLATFQFQYV